MGARITNLRPKDIKHSYIDKCIEEECYDDIDFYNLWRLQFSWNFSVKDDQRTVLYQLINRRSRLIKCAALAEWEPFPHLSAYIIQNSWLAIISRSRNCLPLSSWAPGFPISPIPFLDHRRSLTTDGLPIFRKKTKESLYGRYNLPAQQFQEVKISPENAV